METEPIFHNRKSHMSLGHVYFWTSTIKDWNKLLDIDYYKQIIIDSLKFLINRNKIRIYAFVIMPNHVHFVWQMIEFNGDEVPHTSFLKFTAHAYLKDMKTTNTSYLNKFEVNESTRNHRIWQSDPLAVLMDDRSKVEQKINYIHLNPLQEKWNLVSRPEDYRWSSASYYENGADEFGILTHYMSEF